MRKASEKYNMWTLTEKNLLIKLGKQYEDTRGSEKWNMIASNFENRTGQ